jgi:hypothetical protein
MARCRISLGVMPGLVPGIPIPIALLFRKDRDCRDKPGNDE